SLGPGVELHRSTGTPATTGLVVDLTPGPSNSNLRALTAVRNRVFFARTPGFGYEPWSTDGTTPGTFRLADISPGQGDGIDVRGLAMPCTLPGATQPVLLFLATDGPQTGSSSELWITDGTVAGTRAVGPIGGAWRQQTGAALTMPDGRVVFVATDYYNSPPYSLWVSDGTAAGTFQLATGLIAPAITTRPVYFDGRAWFLQRAIGPVALATDGTILGTVDIQLAGGGPLPGRFTFLGVVAGSLWAIGVESGAPTLYRCDPGTTSFLRAGRPSFTSAQPWYAGDLVAAPRAAVIGGRLLLVDDATAPSLLEFDPTTLATTNLGPIGDADLGSLVFDGARAFTALVDGAGTIRAAVSDGTTQGTSALGDLLPSGGPAPTSSSDPVGFTDFAGRTVFFANHAGAHALWITDGAFSNTRVIANGLVRDPSGHAAAIANGRLFFTAIDVFGRELWMTDGTSAGTRRITDLSASHGSANRLIAFGSDVLFEGHDGTSVVVAATDGTTTRTIFAVPSNQDLVALARVGDRGFFELIANVAPLLGGSSLWSIVNPATAPVRLATFTADRARNGSGLAVFRDRAWFSCEEPVFGATLWSSDGTAAGTRRFAALGGAGRTVRWMVASDHALWVCADSDVMWTDGLNPNFTTIALPQPLTGTSPSRPGVLGDAIVFDHWPNGAVTRELWRADLRSTAPQRVAPIEAPGTGTFEFTTVGRRAVTFVGGDPATTFAESEPWVTDGTAVGTRRLASLGVRAAGGTDRALTVAGGKLWFGAWYGTLDVEPWLVDLSALATRAGDACGSAGSAPDLFADGDPVIGTTFAFEGRGRGVTSAVRLFSIGTPPSIAMPLLGRCELWTADSAVIASPTLATTAGVFRVPLAVPPGLALLGATLTVQALVAPTSAPLGVDLTNAVVLRVGT
ncbi:MAG: hypothetical protein HZB39_15730, partial [Planctomycetes bacterium]|nr:hypothetical protein [Planctomycetota bacterium]